MAERPVLRLLAERAGILPSYLDCAGVLCNTSDETRQALLAALGLDGATEAAARRTLAELDRRDAQRLLDPVRTVAASPSDRLIVPLRVPPECSSTLDYHIRLTREDGRTFESDGRATAQGGVVEARIVLQPAVGYHRVEAAVRGGDFERRGHQLLIMPPRCCLTPEELLGDRRVFGVWTNLYTIRSRRNCGVGDIGDLKRLLAMAREMGAAFVGLSPLHATRNRGHAISPYRPTSRLFNNPIYIDLEAVPELSECPEARAILESAAFRDEVERFRRAGRVEYEGIAALQRPVIEALHRTFRQGQDGRAKGTADTAVARTQRGRDYAEYVRAQGQALLDFAAHAALQEHLELENHRGGWRSRPTGYRDAGTEDVQAFRQRHQRQIDFHCYVQFELDRQLAEASREARALGMPIGLCKDLALGVDPDGSEPWAHPELFVEGAGIGAPPDALGPEGQDWGLPPLNPHTLSETRYEYWIKLLRSSLAHCGALRIDHVMGLERQFWIPRGFPASQGAYVRYPADDLFAVLAIESRRSGALIIGEDLGTVPHGFREKLARWGVLSTHVMCLEYDAAGELVPAEQYRQRAIATVNTHDLPPLAGWWQGRDLQLRRQIGAIPDDQRLALHRDRRQREKSAMLRRLPGDGGLTGASEPSHDALCDAAHRFLARTPCALVAVSLDDVADETEPVNLPGVGPEDFPGWSRRMGTTLEDLPELPLTGRTSATMEQRRW